MASLANYPRLCLQSLIVKDSMVITGTGEFRKPIIANQGIVAGGDSTVTNLTVTGTLSYGGLDYQSRVVNAATDSPTEMDTFLFVDHTATAPVTITLPIISNIPGNEKIYHIIDSGGNAQTNNITIVAGGTDTINGETDALIDVDHNSFSLVSDGTSRWLVF